MSESATPLVLISRSPADTQAMGRALAAALLPGDVVALVGDLGTGKTQWVKGLAGGLGVDPDAVHSPTFTLVNEYEASARADIRVLCHADVYRMGAAVELEAIGFDEIVRAGDSVVAVEWADRVADLIPPGAIWIRGQLPPDGGPEDRRYELTGGAAVLAAMRSFN
ncbi:MAG: hypothetical protein BIFFINMI_00415 [Phycisphaerae bacterium]|nr:hypothetical protein [Phycisphaerae bacterium]